MSLQMTGGNGHGMRVPISKVDTTMSDRQAHQLARRYDTVGPLPKDLGREDRMKAYEARFIASGGRKAEKWKRRSNAAELGRNAALATATGAAGGLLLRRGRRTGAAITRIPKIGRHLTERRMETSALGAGLAGGWSELYGEHAQARRKRYTTVPAGVAGSALTRMRGYTPDPKGTR